MYRGFIKNIDNLAGRAISSSDMRITNINLKRDILLKTTSDFTLVAMPKVVREGDVFGVYDDYGKVVYLGIIKSTDENVIQCDQMYGLFDDHWKWHNPKLNTIEGKIKSILENDYAGSNDSLEAQIFSAFSIITTSATENDFESQDKTYVVNMMKFLFDLYESYGIMLDFDISFNAVTPIIKIGKPNYPVIKLGNNNQILRNFDIIKETQEINKLVIYDGKGEVVRATYYATPSGITTNDETLDRLTDINTKIVCSDDKIVDIVASNLSEEMYNHKITCQLVLANRLYNFDDFHLGQQFDIYYDGELYNSILTGYSIKIDNQGEASVIDLVFGKVRYSLENVIYKLQKDNSANSVSSDDVPTKTSDLVNDSGFITEDYHDDTKQDELVSSVNIKTINGQSILGSGNIVINNNSILIDTTANWNARRDYVAGKGVIVVYSDGATGTDGKKIPKMKVGDGDAYVVDLPFVSQDIYDALNAHITNSEVHITAQERTFWNNKVTADVTGNNLILTKL